MPTYHPPDLQVRWYKKSLKRREDGFIFACLSEALFDVYLETGRGDDLNDSIEVGRKAAAFIPDKDKRKARFLFRLGPRLAWHFKRTGLTVDLDESIEIGRMAQHLTPDDHPEMAEYILTVAGGLLLRSERMRSAE